MAPAKRRTPADSQCQAVPRTNSTPVSRCQRAERRFVERRIDAHAQRESRCRAEPGRARAISSAGKVPFGCGRIYREGAAVRTAHEARRLGVPRAPLPVRRRRGEVGLGDDPRDARAVVHDGREERPRRDGDAHATIGSLRRDGDVMRGVRGRRAGLRARIPRRPRRATPASAARRRSRCAPETRRARPRAGPRPATRLADRGPSARSSGGIEERPGLRAIRRGRRVEQDAQHGHSRRAEARLHRRSLLDPPGPSRSLDDLPDDRRRCAAAAAHERARAGEVGPLARLDGDVEIAAVDGQPDVARERRAVGQSRPELGDGGEGLRWPGRR